MEEFVRRFGYPDKNSRPDRLNFGGVHRVDRRQASTGLTMRLIGYDSVQKKIGDVNGAIALVTEEDVLGRKFRLGSRMIAKTRGTILLNVATANRFQDPGGKHVIEPRPCWITSAVLPSNEKDVKP